MSGVNHKKASKDKGVRSDRPSGKAYKKTKPEKKRGTMASEIAHFNVLTRRKARMIANRSKTESKVGNRFQPKPFKIPLASDALAWHHIQQKLFGKSHV